MQPRQPVRAREKEESIWRSRLLESKYEEKVVCCIELLMIADLQKWLFIAPYRRLLI